jgi:hypothetical protein
MPWGPALEFHPALLLGKRFQAIGGVFDFAVSLAPCPSSLDATRASEQENQDGINRDRHGVSGRNPPLLFPPLFALGPSAACAHRHVGVGKDAGHDAARAYQ